MLDTKCSGVVSEGRGVVRAQDGSTAFDNLEAQILALDPGDVPCMTLLLFGGPASIDALTATLGEPKSAVLATTDCLQLGGYARRRLEARRVASSYV